MQAALRYGEELAAKPLQITMTRTQQMFGLWLVGLHAAVLRVASGLTTRSACGPRPRSWPSCSSASRLRGTSRPGAVLPRQRDSATRTGRHHAARHQPSGGYETPEPAEDIRSKPAANSARRAHPVRRGRPPPAAPPTGRCRDHRRRRPPPASVIVTVVERRTQADAGGKAGLANRHDELVVGRVPVGPRGDGARAAVILLSLRPIEEDENEPVGRRPLGARPSPAASSGRQCPQSPLNTRLRVGVRGVLVGA